MEFLRSFLRNSTIPQINTLKSLKKNEPRSPQINFNLLAFSRPIQISVSSEILYRRLIMGPRDKANWNLRVKTAALETILEVVEFWFMSVLADLCFCMRNEQLIYTRGSYEIFDSFLKLRYVRSQPFIPSKIFQSCEYREVIVKYLLLIMNAGMEIWVLFH